jgi:hypothetical protein
MHYRTTKIIRKNATKGTLKCEVRNLKDDIKEYEILIKQVERDCIRTVSKYNKNIAKLKIRLEEMEKRYNEKL